MTRIVGGGGGGAGRPTKRPFSNRMKIETAKQDPSEVRRDNGESHLPQNGPAHEGEELAVQHSFWHMLGHAPDRNSPSNF